MFNLLSSSKAIVSFLGQKVQIVHARARHGALTIDRNLTLGIDELDRYLASDKTRSYTVIADFETLRQEIIYIPRTKEKYLKPLIENEIKTRFADLGECTFFYNILGIDVSYEGKKWFETAVFAVSTSECDQLIDRFDRLGKTVDILLPDIVPLLGLIHTEEATGDDLQICAIDLGARKKFILHRGNKLYFTRDVLSGGIGFNAEDIMNLNMTINYAAQTLKFMPDRITLMGYPCDSDMPDLELPLPTRWLDVPSQLPQNQEQTFEQILPMSAMLPSKRRGWGNLLPAAYRHLLQQKRILSAVTMVCIAVTIAATTFIAIKAPVILKRQENVHSLKTDVKQMERIVPLFESHRRELERLKPFVTLINSQFTSPDVQKVLIATAPLGSVEFRTIKVKEIRMNVEGTALKAVLKGELGSKTYAATQSDYQRMLERLKAGKTMSIDSERLNLQDKSFEVALKAP